MKKKILLISLLLILLTGCKAKYETKMYLGGTVVENGTVYIDSNLLGKGEYPKKIDDFLEQISIDYGVRNFRGKTKFESKNYFGYKFRGKYSTLSLFLVNSPTIETLFAKKTYTTKDNISSLEFDDAKISDYHQPEGDISKNLEKIEISISLPYKVLSNNAAKVDKDNNTYTWIVTPNKEDNSIKLRFNEKELYTNNPIFLIPYVRTYVYIFYFLLIILIIVSISIIKRVKEMESYEKF